MRAALAASLATALIADFATGQDSELARRLDAVVRAATGPKFFGAVLIARDGQTILRRGYGSESAGRSIDTSSLFDVASIGKQFTAAGLLLLEGKGRLSTQDRLDAYFRRVPRDKADITIHQLLTHTSGLPRNIELTEAERDSREAMVQRIFSIPLDNPPGEQHAYSNVGYQLLAALIETVTKRSFERLLRRELFEPAAMADSGFVGDAHLSADRAAPRWEARSDLRHGDTAIAWPWHWGFRGAAGIVTSADDLYRWDRALHDSKVLSTTVRAKFFSPGADGYALGWEASRTRRHSLRLSHTGRCYGFKSLFIRYPDEVACIIVLGNLDARVNVLDLDLSRELFAAPPSAQLLSDVAGRYELPRRGGTVELAVRGDQLVLRPSGVELVARSRYGEPTASGDAFNRPAFRELARSVLEPLVQGYQRKLVSSFAPKTPPAEIERCCTEWNRCVERHGRCRGVEILGSDPKRQVSWITAKFGATAIRWKAQWSERHRLSKLSRDDSQEHPFELPLRWRRGKVFHTRTADGFSDLEVEVVKGRRGIELRWRDRSTGDQRLELRRR